MSEQLPKVSVIFLLYNAENTVGRLVDAILKQRHPDYKDQSEWLEVLFMDDGSRDSTAEKLKLALLRHGSPAHLKPVINSENLGLSRTLNKAFALIHSPYGLTCHLDCFFGREDYVSEMLRLMESRPDAAAITGQPAIEPDQPMPLAEKVNLVANLMDIFPAETASELLPVGFAEGRCDIFRKEALQAAGYYDTTLRTAGEDQLLAARMREKGYEIYQAPGLPYYLSVSEEQNSLWKLLKHQHLFGRTQPYILLSNRKSLAGIVGESAGGNRRARMVLRISQLLSCMAYFAALAGVLAHLPAWLWSLPLILTLLLKLKVFGRHLGRVQFSGREMGVFWAIQPFLDVYYAAGLMQGVLSFLRGQPEGKTIT